jgi:AcrR family transcriptional regulator
VGNLERKARLDRRKTILDVAARLFRDHGHEATTIADIARAARVAVGSVYLDFASKEAIIEELSRGTHSRVVSAMREAAERASKKEFAARLEAVLEARLRVFLAFGTEGTHVCELVHGRASGVLSAHALYKEEERTFFTELLGEAKRDGALAGDLDPSGAAALLQRAFATLSPPFIFNAPEAPTKRLSAELCRLVVLGLARRS